MTPQPVHAVVSAEEALTEPYPYVHVEADGSVRELHPAERDYLQESFSPFDGGRPYVKGRYADKNGWGSIEGFCRRSELPDKIAIADAPAADPNPPKDKAAHIEWLKSKMTGFAVEENADGTVSMKRLPKS